MNIEALLAWPQGMPLLLAAPAMWLALYAMDRARTRQLARCVGPRLAALTPQLDVHRRGQRRTLVCVALLLALVAALQPRWGRGDERFEAEGPDLVVCLDVSRSMLARDMAPNRLAFAQERIGALADLAQGSRLALVVFAGDARLVVPLTHDALSFAELVSLADPTSVERGGTDLGAALRVALAALGPSPAAGAVVLLITDGEDHGGSGFEAAQACRERGVTVHTVGLGSARGSKIVLPGKAGEEFLRDGDGHDVVSAMDGAGLRRLAQETGGVFVDASVGQRPLLDWCREIIAPAAGLRRADAGSGAPANRYQWPLLAACLLWMLELSLTDRRRA